MSFVDQLATAESLLQGVTAPTAPSPPDLNCLRRHVVRDILPADLRRPIFLVLESPHVDEVAHHYPLAGTSGRDVTSVLSDVFRIPRAQRSLAFGQALVTHALQNLPDLARVGIINASNLPLQRRAYCTTVKTAFAPLLKHFKTIRGGPTAKSRDDPTTAQIERLIVDCLRDRIYRIEATRNDACYVLCGGVARALFRKATSHDRTPPKTLPAPHPSYGNWKKTHYRETIRLLSFRLRRRFGP